MTLRIGIVGAARIAPTAIIAPSALVPGVRVSAIAARDRDRAKVFADTHAIPAVADSYEALVRRDDVDLVYIATPPGLHDAHARLAIATGKPVLLEKPSCANAAETRALVKHAADQGVRLIEAFHYRYHPLFSRVLDILRSGEIGPIERATAVFNANIRTDAEEIRWRTDMGGGALMDLGCYCVHWLRQIAMTQPLPAGEPAHGSLKVLEAQVERAPSGVDVTTRAVLRFPSGFEGVVETSMAPRDGVRRASLAIEGEDGALVVTNPLAPQLGHDLALTKNGVTRHESLTPDATFTFQLAAIKEALVSNAPLPTEGADTIANMDAIDAIYQAGGFKRG